MFLSPSKTETFVCSRPRRWTWPWSALSDSEFNRKLSDNSPSVLLSAFTEAFSELEQSPRCRLPDVDGVPPPPGGGSFREPHKFEKVPIWSARPPFLICSSECLDECDDFEEGMTFPLSWRFNSFSMLWSMYSTGTISKPFPGSSGNSSKSSMLFFQSCLWWKNTSFFPCEPLLSRTWSVNPIELNVKFVNFA